MKKYVMKSAIKVVLGAMCLGIGCNIVSPVVSYAETVKTVQKYSYNELIDIVNPYIVETFNSYYIRDEQELLQKIGKTNLDTLKQRLVVANKEKIAALQRDAVSETHIKILREAGAVVESHWWGKRIKTYDRDTAIKVRRLASGFSGQSGTDGLVWSLVTAGIMKLTGIGGIWLIVKAVSGIEFFAGANSETWTRVSNQVADKIEEGQYNLTIDINAWYIDVRVY